jgi:hypothetical protein
VRCGTNEELRVAASRVWSIQEDCYCKYRMDPNSSSNNQEEAFMAGAIPRKKRPVLTAPVNAPISRRTVSIRLPMSSRSPAAAQKKPTTTKKVRYNKLITQISESPLMLRIATTGMSRTEGIYSNDQRTSRSATSKRPRSVYLEDTDTENDDLIMDEAELSSVLPAKKMDPNAIEAPPSGTIATLWYSRECFLHVFVLDKVCGWKTRPVVVPAPDAAFDAAPAASAQLQLLLQANIWADPAKRMQVSRVNPLQCPIVLTWLDPQAVVVTEEREEVVLVKWRGRSYLHCSWERVADLERLDTSQNQTARHKIRRFFQHKESEMGEEWKQVLEEERVTAAKIHSHGGPIVDASAAESVVPTADLDEEPGETEEFFSSQCLEIERIMACDENQMSMQVLAKQRACNIRDEQEAIRRKEETTVATGTTSTTSSVYQNMIGPILFQRPLQPQDWDPEDNVRYVVKWKGLPYAEMTWEYWRDIKRDAVDEAEDFWHRQIAPDPDVKDSPHPHIRDFRKLQGSPAYGVSSRERPVADLTSIALSSSGGDDDEADTSSGFQLRSYQLEGVNWLLFNWWNKRSCILADEMGLGKVGRLLNFAPLFVLGTSHSVYFPS